jgi:POT family proton-dependent oligopeptide transporter
MDIVLLIGIVVTALTLPQVLLQMRKHPPGLHILFFAEMWERFSYYGMRSLLVFYMTQHFLMTREEGNLQYGAYTSLVYLLPLIGGYLADKYLGTRKAIAFGALLLVAGHALMAVEGDPARAELKVNGAAYEFVSEGRGDSRNVELSVGGTRCALNPGSGHEGCAIRVEDRETGVVNDKGEQETSRHYVFEGVPAEANFPAEMNADEWKQAYSIQGRNPLYMGIFFLALSLIVMGVGFLKSNISAIVGQLYPAGDPRRDPGFTLYYFGINFGSFWATILCGMLLAKVGWWAGFGLAGVGMLLGYLVFVRGRFLFFTPGPSQLPDNVGRPPEPELLKAKLLGPLSREHLIYLGGILGVGFVWFFIQRTEAIGALLSIGSVIVLAYLGVQMVTKFTREERDRLILSLILIAMSVVFWTLFEQAGSSLNLFAEDHTQLTMPGVYSIEAAQTQSFNAGFILLFAPIFAMLWTYLGKLDLDPNPALKFGLALVQVGAAFFFLIWGANYLDADYRMPLIFLALAYMVHTTGELFLSPVGLSMITRLSPATVVSTMMAIWFLSSSWAQYLGGIIASYTSVESVGGQVLDKKESLDAYLKVYAQLGMYTIGLGVLLCLASFWLKKLGHGLAGGRKEAEADAKAAAARKAETP